ncbi:MAG: protein adenylyltransferase SelO [Halothiobacillus sp.]
MATPSPHPPHFEFDHSLARALDGFYAPAQAAPAPAPRLIILNRPLTTSLGLDAAALDSEIGAAIFSGNHLPHGAMPLAQAYAGHQFGNFVPMLGDGRALLLGEVLGRDGRRDIQLKGSGRTPFSRGGDGRAALGPVLREYLVSEAMHALGIPTTRALAAVSTGEHVWRNAEVPGAVLARVAASHIRVGTFQFFAARGETAKVKQLADYVIARHYPALADSPQPYLRLFEAVAEAQAMLVARWMQVGFVHGVMNTDNTTISGETIDYGPCAFMDAYSARAVFSSIDLQGRYAYSNQPVMARWNMARLAETLLPLIHPNEDEALRFANAVIAAFPDRYSAHWLTGMREKLGLNTTDTGDTELIHWLLAIMQEQGADFSLVFRRLSTAVRGDVEPVRALLNHSADFDDWLARWQARRRQETGPAHECAAAMDRVNPLVIPRNHRVEAALAAATEQHDFAPFHELLAAITSPFDERPEFAQYAEPAPANFGPFTTFCGT